MTQNLEDLENIVEKLHELNFGKDGLIEFAHDGGDYHFKRFLQEEKGIHRQKDVNVCQKCNCCDLVQEDGTKCVFTRITHGTHTIDFLDAHGVDHTTVADWSQKPVLFVMENPGAVDVSKNGGDLLLGKGTRCISQKWYWVMGQREEPNEKFFYPNYFVQKEYGWMIYSVIRTFNMANAYVTNMVKCGMTREPLTKKSYLTTDEYPNDGIAKDCIDNFLKKELDDLRGEHNDEKVIVFAFGERTYDRLRETLKDENISLHLLPHPANRLANDDRKYVLFGKILRALLQNHFYEGVEEKPDFEAILTADVGEKEPEKSFEELCIEELERICKGKYKLKKRKSYDPERDDTVICYSFTVNADDETESLILRQAVRGKLYKETQYEVSWAEYQFDDKSISLYAGKKSTANTEIYGTDEEKKEFPIYEIALELKKFYTEHEQSDHSDQ